MTPADLSNLLSTLQSLAVPMLGYGVKVLWDIRSQLQTLNGRMGKLEQWKEDHKDQEDRNIEHLEKRIDQCPAWKELV